MSGGLTRELNWEVQWANSALGNLRLQSHADYASWPRSKIPHDSVWNPWPTMIQSFGFLKPTSDQKVRLMGAYQCLATTCLHSPEKALPQTFFPVQKEVLQYFTLCIHHQLSCRNWKRNNCNLHFQLTESIPLLFDITYSLSFNDCSSFIGDIYIYLFFFDQDACNFFCQPKKHPRWETALKCPRFNWADFRRFPYGILSTKTYILY